jgi:hypothetical protein
LDDSKPRLNERRKQNGRRIRGPEKAPPSTIYPGFPFRFLLGTRIGHARNQRYPNIAFKVGRLNE